MNAKIVTFSSHGDTTLLEYDPATADMEEVNRVIAEYEVRTGAQPFDMATGERISKVTSEQREVLMVHPIAGGYQWTVLGQVGFSSLEAPQPLAVVCAQR